MRGEPAREAGSKVVLSDTRTTLDPDRPGVTYFFCLVGSGPPGEAGSSSSIGQLTGSRSCVTKVVGQGSRGDVTGVVSSG